MMAMKADRKIADEKLAYALLRIFVGLNIMMHGVSRLLAGPSHFTGKVMEQFAHTVLPVWSLQIFGLVLPPVEALIGLLLLLGLRTRAALVAGIGWLLILTFGSSLIQDWQAAGVQLIYALAYAALLFLLRFNALAIDTRLG